MEPFRLREEGRAEEGFLPLPDLAVCDPYARVADGFAKWASTTSNGTRANPCSTLNLAKERRVRKSRAS